MSGTRPVLGITMGCPAGVGPEIILDMFHRHGPGNDHQTVVIGDYAFLCRLQAERFPELLLRRWDGLDPCPDQGIPVLDVAAVDLARHLWGTPDEMCGHAMAAFILRGVECWKQGVLDALVTCPINKKWLNRAGYDFPGHTEMLASLTGGDRYAMMMAGERLKVALVSIHQALRQVPDSLTVAAILDRLTLVDESLRRDFALSAPRIGVAGLNPHAGEEGLFGDEEERCILPAVERAQDMGINAMGPLPPDTVFFRAAHGEFDAVLAMYHDQGLVPFKLLHFVDGVNVTIGLPLVRTSVDHGTAYDIAGQGRACSDSLLAAVTLAHKIVRNRRMSGRSTDPADRTRV